MAVVASSVLSPLVQGDGALAQWLAEQEKNTDSITLDEYESVNLYSANASQEFSPWNVDHLASFCAKGASPVERHLYRGIPGDTAELVAALTPGAVIPGGFVSTSVCPGVAKRFAETSSGNGAVLRILTDKGAALGGYLAAKGDEEREVLLGPDANLRVIGSHEARYVAGWSEETVTVIDCELI